MIMQNQVPELMEATVYDSEGEKIGRVRQVYLDRDTDRPSWVTVHTGLFGMHESFVPLAQGQLLAGDLQVAVTKEAVKEAPRIEAQGELTPERETELYSYYQLEFEATSDTTDEQPVNPTDVNPYQDAMIRSEEQLHVGTEEVERGRARLRKYVVTEHVQQTVPLRHEEVRVEREPITEANRDEVLGEQPFAEAEQEVVLNEERPVISTETVPVEEVRLDKETVIEQQRVSGDVRKEKIDFDQAGGSSEGQSNS